jgi:hypothetical protein
VQARSLGETENDRAVMAAVDFVKSSAPPVAPALARGGSSSCAIALRPPSIAAHSPVAVWWVPRAFHDAQSAEADTSTLRNLGDAIQIADGLTRTGILALSAKAFLQLLLAWDKLSVRDAALEGSLIVGFADHVSSLQPSGFAEGLRAIMLLGQRKAMALGQFARSELPRHCAMPIGQDRVARALLTTLPYHVKRNPDRAVETVFNASLYCGCGGLTVTPVPVPGLAATRETDDASGVSRAFCTLYYGCGLDEGLVRRVATPTAALLALQLFAKPVCEMLNACLAEADDAGRTTNRVIPEISPLRVARGLDVIIACFERFAQLACNGVCTRALADDEVQKSVETTASLAWDAVGLLASVGHCAALLNAPSQHFDARGAATSSSVAIEPREQERDRNAPLAVIEPEEGKPIPRAQFAKRRGGTIAASPAVLPRPPGSAALSTVPSPHGFTAHDEAAIADRLDRVRRLVFALADTCARVVLVAQPVVDAHVAAEMAQSVAVVNSALDANDVVAAALKQLCAHLASSKP